ncbi:MAG: hypothetical protein KAS32_05730 [Candidatus Peribacteraceae bacterium]|nr:hypothetical protein [Candidatus Peribacteraceae bacterium]
MSTTSPYDIKKGMFLISKKSGNIHRVLGSRGDGDRWRLKDIPHNDIDKRTIWNNYEPYCIKCSSKYVDGKCLCVKGGGLNCIRCREKPVMQGHKVCIDCQNLQEDAKVQSDKKKLNEAIASGEISKLTIDFVAKYIINDSDAPASTVVSAYTEGIGKKTWPLVCRLAFLIETCKTNNLNYKEFWERAKLDPMISQKYKSRSQLLKLGTWDWDVPFEVRKNKKKSDKPQTKHSDQNNALTEQMQKEEDRHNLKMAELRAKEEALKDDALKELMSKVSALSAEAVRLGFHKGVTKEVDGLKVSIRYKENSVTIIVEGNMLKVEEA